MAQPLRYRITDWHQLVECQSNNSQKFSIKVADIFDDTKLQCIRISVVHSDYGVLFSTIVDCSGTILSDDPQYLRPFELDTDDILSELYKFGFIVEYYEGVSIPDNVLAYLRTLVDLHYEKIRRLNVWDMVDGVKQYTTFVVGFMPSNVPTSWLLNTYCPHITELTRAFLSGAACNISMSPEGSTYRWDWLDYVANIEDILAENEPESE